jgi:hypothetical protein
MPPPQSHGSTAAPPSASWLWPWIAGHLAAARAGFLRGAAPELVETPQRVAAAARSDRRCTRLARASEIVMLVGALCTVWVLWTGGFHYEIESVPLRMTSLRSPVRVILVAAVLRAVLLDITLGAWPLARSLAAAGRVPLGVRLAILPWAAAGAALAIAASELGDSLETLAERGRRARQGVIENVAHRHLAPLVGLLAHRPDPGPVAVYIDDVNPRGHLASFYSYPRLLCMEQGAQSWSLRVMMWRYPGEDPAFADPGERPSYEAALVWARQKGLDLLWASPEKARVAHGDVGGGQ